MIYDISAQKLKDNFLLSSILKNTLFTSLSTFGSLYLICWVE